MAINTNDRIFTNVATTLDLTEVTTERQRTNGTRAFLDGSLPYTAIYTVHPNGYVRRTVSSSSPYSDEGYLVQYQLNRRCKPPTSNGLTCVLSSSSNESAGILFRGVTNYRRSVSTTA